MHTIRALVVQGSAQAPLTLGSLSLCTLLVAWLAGCGDAEKLSAELGAQGGEGAVGGAVGSSSGGLGNGGLLPGAGGAPPALGGAPPALGGAPPALGGAPPALGGAPPALGGAPVALGGAPVALGGTPPALGGAPPALGGAPPALGGAPGQSGSAGAGQSSCVSGVDTGDACDPAIDVDVCSRSDRDCVCGANGSWTCAPPGGEGGAGAGGGSDSNGGAGDAGAEANGGQSGNGDSGAQSWGGAKEIPKFVGNITTGWNGALDTNGLTYSDYWDQVTPENAGKWGSVQRTPTSDPDWKTLDSIHDYTTSSGVIFKHHCFLWGSQQPEPQTDIKETHVKEWMNAFCQRYPDTAIIDVVNEPPPHTTPRYADAIGGGTNGNWKWISNAFKWAREACPNAVLILNDYNNIEWSNDHRHFIDIVKAIQADDAPIDAIGCQAHDLDHGSVSSSSAKSMIAALHDETGLPIYITEFDISTTDDQAQLAKYQDYFPFFLETEYIRGVTIWGWIFGSTWSMARDSGLVRDGSPRSAMTWLMEELGRPVP